MNQAVIQQQVEGKGADNQVAIWQGGKLGGSEMLLFDADIPALLIGPDDKNRKPLITEAPTDGDIYARQNAEWVLVPISPGGGGGGGGEGDGSQGPPGPPGPQGPQGPAGAAGAKGDTGAVGAQGPQGNPGAAGAQGPQGIPGAPGADGLQGAQGVPGAAGAEGPMGPQGYQGPQGNPGIPGQDGAQGIPGPEGPQGPAGTGINMLGTVPTTADLPTTGNAQGDAYVVQADGDLWVWDSAGSVWNNVGPIQGPEGPAGPQGIQGAQGPQGNPGAQGAQGPAGAAGAQGIPGDDGAAGAQGPQGNAGAQGPAGAKGDTGAVGAQGPQGPQGDTGPQGPAGSADTPAQILAKLVTVDGIGSGLDADLLDGQSGGYYLDRANHTGVQAISTITNLQASLDAKAPLASPALTGNPTAPTPAPSDNDSSIATTAFVAAAVAAAGVPDRIVSVPADMAAAFRTAPNRLVVNDKPDLSGADVAVIDDTGRMALKAATIPAASRSALTLGGDITLVNGWNIGFNNYWDGTVNRAATTGWSANLIMDNSNGIASLNRSAGSVAADAAQTLTAVVIFDPVAGTKFADNKITYTGGPIYNQYQAATVGYYRKTGTGSFSWNKSADGLQSGAGLAQLMALDDSGNLDAIGSYSASTTGCFVGTDTVAVLASAAAGTCYLRPNGKFSPLGQMSVDSTGALSVYAGISASQNFYSSSPNVVLATGAAGSVFLRPNGRASGVGQTSIDSAGAMVVSGSVTSTLNFISSTANAVLATTGAGICYMRPNGAGSASGQTTVDSNGAMSVASTVTAAQNFISSTANVVLAPTGSGTCYLRPSGAASVTGQAYLVSSGDLTIAGANATKASGTTWANPSDVRLKEITGDYAKGLAELLQVQPKTFTFNNQPELGEVIGVVAQDVEGVFPECVTLVSGEIDGQTVADLRQFDASPMIYALINAVHDLSAKLDAATARIATLEAK